MGLGVGLGAFVDGFGKGYGLAQDASARQQQLDEQKKQDAWAQQDHDYTQKQRDLALKEQGDVQSIESDARNTFDAGVKSGEYSPSDFDNFFQSYAVPKMKSQMLLDGDVDGAAKLEDWSTSEATKQGGKLFAGAMMKALGGDPGGALKDAIAAGKVEGYIDHDYDISDPEEIKDANGNVVGYRVSLTDGKGNTLKQDIAVGDVPKVVATFANPESAWQSQQAAAAKTKDRTDDLSDYKAKKDIDASTTGAQKDRADAITELRKQTEGLDAAADAVPFDSLPPDQQEAAIGKEIALQKGAGAQPAPVQPNALVDGQTGQVVAGGPPQSPVGLGQQAPAAAANPAPYGYDNGVPATAPMPVLGGDPGLPAPMTPAQPLPAPVATPAAVPTVVLVRRPLGLGQQPGPQP